MGRRGRRLSCALKTMFDDTNSKDTNRVTVTREQFFDLLRGDLKLLRKLLCITRHLLSCGVADQKFNELLRQGEHELLANANLMLEKFAAIGIDAGQSLDEFPADSFLPPVAGRECLFARNGIFMDAKACFQTRDIPLNTVTPFHSVKSAYFLLEHTHEALEMSCQLRLKQLDYLHKQRPDIIIDETNGPPQQIEQTTDQQLAIARSLLFQIGKYAYGKSQTYGAMLDHK